MKITKSLRLFLVILAVVFLLLVSATKYFNKSSFSTYKNGDLSLNYPKYWLVKQDGSLRDPLGIFEFKVIKNQVGYGEQFYRCSDNSKECNYVTINGIKSCVYSTPSCLQSKKGSLSTKECTQTSCGRIFLSGVCVDGNGQEPTTGIGCANLLKAGSKYAIYNFQLSCKNIPLIGMNESKCKELYGSMLNSIKFSGDNSYAGWKLHTEEKYSFMYPSDYNIIDSSNQVKLVLPNGNRFMVMRVDSSIKDLDKFVSLEQGPNGTNKSVTLTNVAGKTTYQLYDWLNINGKKVRRDIYLLNIDGVKSDVLWMDSYVYELPIGEYGLVVDKILGSIKFN